MNTFEPGEGEGEGDAAGEPKNKTLRKYTYRLTKNST